MPAAFVHFSRPATLTACHLMVAGRDGAPGLFSSLEARALRGGGRQCLSLRPGVVTSRSAATMNHHRGGMSGRGV